MKTPKGNPMTREGEVRAIFRNGLRGARFGLFRIFGENACRVYAGNPAKPDVYERVNLLLFRHLLAVSEWPIGTDQALILNTRSVFLRISTT